MSARSQKVPASILGVSPLMEPIPPSSPSLACSPMWPCSRVMPRHGARIGSTSLRIMINAISADGGLLIAPAAMVRLCATGQAILDVHEGFGLRATSQAQQQAW
jgi:hypothetical protein